MSMIYNNSLIDFSKIQKIDILIFSLNKDKRATYLFEQIKSNNIQVNQIIIIDYFNICKNRYLFRLGSTIPSLWNITKTQTCINYCQSINLKSEEEYILLDISVLRTPDLFNLVKFFHMNKKDINVSYSVPKTYLFADKPYTTYESYHGDLLVEIVHGFNGLYSDEETELLMIFMGFEGTLAYNIKENTPYKDLILVNTLPSFYEKYKDITVLNNKMLIEDITTPILFSHVSNPFQTYNFLEKELANRKNICIAPLCTKTNALGICLYCLSHDNVRIKYPISDNIHEQNSDSVQELLSFEIPLSKL